MTASRKYCEITNLDLKESNARNFASNYFMMPYGTSCQTRKDVLVDTLRSMYRCCIE